MENKKELEYFNINDAVGGNQMWFRDPMMYLGGCAAVTACDVSIYLALYKHKEHLYPFDPSAVSKKDYLAFARQMKPYLRPRKSGIDTLEIYMDGIKKYWEDMGETNLSIEGVSGDEPFMDAKTRITNQIDAGYPVPFLLLRHKKPELDDFVWHWFILAGYRDHGDSFDVKVITYGKEYWMSLADLWDTGYERKGGVILIHE